MNPKVTDSLKKRIACYVSTKLVVDNKFVKHIIGKNGSNINRVKNDTGVKINISESKNNSNTIRIEGQKDGVKLAKSELEEMIYKLENEVEKEILIYQRHHRAIIGVKGVKVRVLQKAYNVQIAFPSSVEARSDFVKIRGLNDDVNKAFKSLAKLAKELDEANYVLEIPVFKQFHKLVVGKGGANIKKIREKTDTRIDLPRESEDSDIIKVTGNKENVLIASYMIKKIQNEMGDIVTKEIVLGNVKVRNIIVNLGNRFIQSIKEDCGGNVTLKLPAVKGDNTIVIKGLEGDVDSAISQIQTMVYEVHNSVIDLKVKPEFHKYLIGKKRANVKRIRDSTNTRIIFPPKTDSTNESIIIVGKKENVGKAKAEFEVMIGDISNVVKERVEINEKYHKSFVAKRGKILHKLEDECGGVKISFPKHGTGDKVIFVR